MASPLVTLLILNWNGESVIEKCIGSLQQQSFGNFEILVIDNGSTDKSLDMLKQYKDILLIRNSRNVGYAAGNNIGFSKARGKYVAALNNDIIAEPNWLEAAIPHLESDPSVGIVGSRQMNYFNRSIIDGLYQIVRPSLNFYHYGADEPYNPKESLHATRGYVIGASGASAIYRKALIDALAGFEEMFFAYHEDTDLHFRAFWNGWKCLYEPQAVVYHMRSKTLGFRSPSYVYFFERNRYWFMVKNYPIAKLLSRIPLLLLSEARLCKTYAPHPALLSAYLRGRKDGMKGLAAVWKKRIKHFDPSLRRSFTELKKRQLLPVSS
jgi:GT2 family glycosyltransferase